MEWGTKIETALLQEEAQLPSGEVTTTDPTVTEIQDPCLPQGYRYNITGANLFKRPCTNSTKFPQVFKAEHKYMMVRKFTPKKHAITDRNDYDFSESTTNARSIINKDHKTSIKRSVDLSSFRALGAEDLQALLALVDRNL
ncbi:UNVERIFIED_CONTAM: hypothetical protein NCL1_51485 [Trichonephila clavipes]